MVQILCPHCKEEIELDDDASGEFACPYCEGEFEWNMNPEHNDETGEGHVLLNVISGFFSGSLMITGIALLFGSYVGFQLSSVLWAATAEGSESAGAGIVAVMGIAGAGYLISLSIGMLGLSILIIGIYRILGR